MVGRGDAALRPGAVRESRTVGGPAAGLRGVGAGLGHHGAAAVPVAMERLPHRPRHHAPPLRVRGSGARLRQHHVRLLERSRQALEQGVLLDPLPDRVLPRGCSGRRSDDCATLRAPRRAQARVPVARAQHGVRHSCGRRALHASRDPRDIPSKPIPRHPPGPRPRHADLPRHRARSGDRSGGLPARPPERIRCGAHGVSHVVRVRRGRVPRRSTGRHLRSLALR